MTTLSILLPTHNRPTLFNRCIGKLLNLVGTLKSSDLDKVEIIVNNDSDDITEVRRIIGNSEVNIQYHYEHFDNLSDIYKYLVNQASGEYVWFLEDDDMPTIDLRYFLSELEDCPYNCLIGNYMPEYFDFSNMDEYRVESYNFEEFQLSQCIFKRDLINFEGFRYQCSGNCIHLDYALFKQFDKTHKYPKLMFIQTTDGKDNISFSEYTDLSKCKTCIFKKFLASL